MAFTFFGLATHVAAATLDVNGGAANCSDSTGTPYCKIQAAIDAAADADTVLVAPGTYQENINFMGKAITVRSDQGAAVTIIDGGAADTVAYFGNGETTASVLDGFTLQNGLASAGPLASTGNGGGFYIIEASPTIRNNIITGNIADHPGFGIEINRGSPIIDGNTITNNRCSGNISGGGGGAGIRLIGAGAAQIINNTIDAGDSGDPNLPSADFAGNSRVEGGSVDMGAYEFYPNPGYLEFSASSFSAVEGDLSATITVMRKAGRTGTVTVDITTTDDTGSAGSDYTAVSETVTFNDGDMADKSVTVTILNDSVDENLMEFVSLELSNPTGGATLGSTSTAELSIMDDERIPYTDWLPEEGNNVCFIMTIAY